MMIEAKGMQLHKCTLKTLTPVILSPRSAMAFYKDIDYEESEYPYNMIYPFYRYGEYHALNPDSLSHYIPGSSIKGAMTFGSDISKSPLSFFVEDSVIPSNECIEVISLNKSQYFNNPTKESQIPKIAAFFDGTVGFECLKAETELNIEVRYAGNFHELLAICSDNTKRRCKNDIVRLEKHLENIKSLVDCDTNPDRKTAYDSVINQINTIKSKMDSFLCCKNLILIGGYKGLYRSMDSPNIDAKSAIYATTNNEPLGFAEIIIKKEDYDGYAD